MVVGVGAAGEWELWGWDPLGAAVFVFSGPPAAGGDEAVVGAAGEGEPVDVGQAAVGPFIDVVGF